MAKNEIAKSNANIAAKFERLFGPPPVHKFEDEEIYNAILCGLVRDIGPLDAIEDILLRDLTGHAYEIQWLRRLRHQLIREVHKQELARRAERLVGEAQVRIGQIRAANASKTPKADLPGTDKAVSDAEVAAETEKITAEAREKLEKLTEAENGEIDEAALFRNWIALYDAVESRLTVVERKFHLALEALDEHRQGLGQRLREFAERTIDAEPSEDPATTREGQLSLARSPMTADEAKAS
jgi:hypothetical protein